MIITMVDTIAVIITDTIIILLTIKVSIMALVTTDLLKKLQEQLEAEMEWLLLRILLEPRIQ